MDCDVNDVEFAGVLLQGQQGGCVDLQELLTTQFGQRAELESELGSELEVRPE
jgi:hypothetical protein